MKTSQRGAGSWNDREKSNPFMHSHSKRMTDSNVIQSIWKLTHSDYRSDEKANFHLCLNHYLLYHINDCSTHI